MGSLVIKYRQIMSRDKLFKEDFLSSSKLFFVEIIHKGINAS